MKRKLLPFEVVHHINFMKDDNRAENLCVMTAKNHDLFHEWCDALGRKKMWPGRTTQIEKLHERYGARFLG